MATCAGSPTFEAGSKNPNRFLEWPVNIPGYVCKTPPFGRGNAPRFSQCCSGSVYNITSPSNSGDPEYPMSCAVFCQVDPRLSEPIEGNPGGLSPHMMCLTDGGIGPHDWEVVCATNTAASNAAWPTSYPSTIPGGETVSGPSSTSASRTSTAVLGTGSGTGTIPPSATGSGQATIAAPAATTTSASSGRESVRGSGLRGTVLKGCILGLAVLVMS